MMIVADIELAANIKGDKKNEFLRSKTLVQKRCVAKVRA
jgi:hypothetical protein